MRKSDNTPAAASGAGTNPGEPDAADGVQRPTEYQIAARHAERALRAGDRAPSFRKWDQRGVEAASETLLRNGSLLLAFDTGVWCPACGPDLQAFGSLRPLVGARGRLS